MGTEPKWPTVQFYGASSLFVRVAPTSQPLKQQKEISSLSGVVDIFSRMAVGWAMGNWRDEQLVTDALMMAVVRRRPHPGLLHHSDRGSQYTSQGYLALLRSYDVEVSMSKKADCYDNALMESFFGTVKEECVYRHTFRTRSEARQTIFEYLEVFYNRTRRHSALGQVSPLIYEQKAIEDAQTDS
jgi:putative transposase